MSLLRELDVHLCLVHCWILLEFQKSQGIIVVYLSLQQLINTWELWWANLPAFSKEDRGMGLPGESGSMTGVGAEGRRKELLIWGPIHSRSTRSSYLVTSESKYLGRLCLPPGDPPGDVPHICSYSAVPELLTRACLHLQLCPGGFWSQMLHIPIRSSLIRASFLVKNRGVSLGMEHQA